MKYAVLFTFLQLKLTSSEVADLLMKDAGGLVLRKVGKVVLSEVAWSLHM